MSTTPSVRAETEAGVRSIILCRPGEYNTITPALRDELAAAIDEADADPGVRVILLRTEGPAFCAAYGLDWSTALQAAETGSERISDSVTATPMVSRLETSYMQLCHTSHPLLAAI